MFHFTHISPLRGLLIFHSTLAFDRLRKPLFLLFTKKMNFLLPRLLHTGFIPGSSCPTTSLQKGFLSSGNNNGSGHCIRPSLFSRSRDIDHHLSKQQRTEHKLQDLLESHHQPTTDQLKNRWNGRKLRANALNLFLFFLCVFRIIRFLASGLLTNHLNDTPVP